MSPHQTEPTYYDFLGIAPSATPAEIRSAYRAKAVKLHPDKQKTQASSPDDFLFLQRVRDTLLDADARKAYDRVLEAHERSKRREAEMTAERRSLVAELLRKEREAEEEASRLFAAQQRKINGDRVARGVGKWLLRRNGAAPAAARRSVRLFWDAKVPSGFYTAELLRTRLSAFGDVVGVWLRGCEAVAVFKDGATADRVAASVERGHCLGDGSDRIDAEPVRAILDEQDTRKGDFFAFEQAVLARYSAAAAAAVQEQAPDPVVVVID